MIKIIIFMIMTAFIFPIVQIAMNYILKQKVEWKGFKYYASGYVLGVLCTLCTLVIAKIIGYL